ncbi:hypothetical protein ACFLQ2_05240 [archaeon]
MKGLVVVLLFLLLAGCTEYGEVSQAVDDAFLVAIGLKEPAPTPVPTATPEPTAQTDYAEPDYSGYMGYSPPTDKFEWAEELGCGPADPKNDEFVRACINKFRDELEYSMSFSKWLETKPDWADMNIWGQQNRYATYLWKLMEAELYGCEETECQDEHGCHESGTQWETDALYRVYCCDEGMTLHCPLDMGQKCGELECRYDIEWEGNDSVYNNAWSDCYTPDCLAEGECLANGTVTGLIYCNDGYPAKCTEKMVGYGVGTDWYTCAKQGDGRGWIRCYSCWQNVGDTCRYEGQDYECQAMGTHYVWVLEE